MANPANHSEGGERESQRVNAYMATLLEAYGPALPDLSLEVIPQDGGYPPNRTLYCMAGESDPGTLVKASWTTRNGKLAIVTKSVILSTRNDDATRIRLDQKVAEHRRRSTYELSFDPMALALIRFYTEKTESEIRHAVTHSTGSGAIELLFGPAPDVEARIEALDPRFRTHRDLHQDGAYRTWMTLTIVRGKINVIMRTPDLTWETAKRMITLGASIPHTVGMALAGRGLDAVVGEDFARGYHVRRVDRTEHGDGSSTSYAHYSHGRSSADAGLPGRRATDRQGADEAPAP